MKTTLVLAVLWSHAAAAQVDPDPWFAPDKAIHFSVSAGLSAAGYAGASFFTDDVRVKLGVGAGVSLVAGIAKEVADLLGLGHPSWKDFAWDVAGNGFGLLMSWLLDHFVIRKLCGDSVEPLHGTEPHRAGHSTVLLGNWPRARGGQSAREVGVPSW